MMTQFFTFPTSSTGGVWSLSEPKSRSPTAARFGLTVLLARTGGVNSFGICFQAFAQRVHEIDDVARLPFRLGDLDDVALGLALDEFPQRRFIFVLEFSGIKRGGLGLQDVRRKRDHILADAR
jgi:hypothetical protein